MIIKPSLKGVLMIRLKFIGHDSFDLISTHFFVVDVDAWRCYEVASRKL